MKDLSYKKLIDMAKGAKASAYAPYSKISVGAALLSRNGKVYLGSNIENAAYSPTVCAERVAFFKAISDGEREFQIIAVVGGSDCEQFPPCGVCRQIMTEFCDNDFEIVLESTDGYRVITLGELLPHAFGKRNLR